MGLRGKMLALFITGFGLMAYLALHLLEDYLDERFLAIEHQQALAQMAQLIRHLNGDLEKLSLTTSELGNRDDTHDFVLHPSKTFSDSHLAPSTLKAAGVNYLAILDEPGNTLLTRAITLAAQKPGAVSGADDTLPNIKKRVARSMPDPEKACGLDMSAAGPILLCWQAIRSSDGAGKPAGLIVLGRFLNENLLKEIQTLTDIHFELNPLPVLDANPVTEIRKNIEPTRVEFSQTEPAILNARLPDLFGQPILKVRLQFPAELGAESHVSALRLFRSLLLVTVLTGLLLFFSVHYLILHRLQKMAMELRRIWRNGRWAERIDLSTGSDELSELGQSVNRMLGLIRKQVMILDSIAHTDTLTQIANRRAFDRRLLIEMSLHNRNQTSLSLLIADIDHFKQYNDYFGYPAGDDVLKEIGKLLVLVACRPSDLPARIGGEEFAVILPATDLNGACHVAQLLQTRLAELKIPQGDAAASEFLTVSIGVVTAADDDVESFMQRAEKAVYNAKQSGRNRTATLTAG